MKHITEGILQLLSKSSKGLGLVTEDEEQKFEFQVIKISSQQRLKA